jgi:hypothetical protein
MTIELTPEQLDSIKNNLPHKTLNLETLNLEIGFTDYIKAIKLIRVTFETSLHEGKTIIDVIKEIKKHPNNTANQLNLAFKLFKTLLDSSVY